MSFPLFIAIILLITGSNQTNRKLREVITRWQDKSVVFDASYNVFDDKVLRKNFNEFME